MAQHSLQTFVAKLPHKPGVYLYKDAAGVALYIGKAKNLKKRVSSYFTATDDHKINELLRLSTSIDFIVTKTEIDALTLEDSLIRKHQPKYNVLLRDDSSYRYIIVTKKAPYRIFVSRSPQKTAFSFGPYPFSLHYITKVARDILGLTTHGTITPPNWQHYQAASTLTTPSKTPNLSQETLQQFIDRLIKTIRQGDKELVNLYRSQMEYHAKRLEYEQALTARNKIALLEKIVQRTAITEAQRQKQTDLIILFEQKDDTYIFVFQIRAGLVNHIKKTKFPNLKKPLNLLNSFLKQYYTHTAPPKELWVHSATAQEVDPAIAPYLTQLHGQSVTIKQVTQKTPFVALAYENIYAQLGITSNLMAELKQLLTLQHVPTTLEFLDISNLQDSIIVGGVTHYNQGKPNKSLWRYYKITSTSGQDDFGSITETTTRRYSKNALPDVLVVDGGLGQLQAARKGIRNAGKSPDALCIVGLTKEYETLVFHQGPAKRIDQSTDAGKFLIRGRDTVHNFVIQYTRKVFEKQYKQSFLDTIIGIGPTTKFQLFHAFGSANAIKAASPEALATVIGKHKAKLIVKKKQ